MTRAIFSTALLSLLLPATAFASVCESEGRAFLEGPVPLSFQNGQLGVSRRACPRNEVVLGGDGNVIVEPKNFYGNVKVGGLLGGSWAISDRVEVFGSLEFVRYQSVISAFTADHLGIGHTSLGGTWRFLDSGALALAATTRVTLPTASGLYENTLPFALDGGLVGGLELSSLFTLHGQLGFLTSAAISAGPAQPRFGLILNVGGTYRPADWFALVVDLDAQSFYASALDHLAVGLGFRFAVDQRGIELLLKTPIAGRERAAVLGLLRLRYDFDVDLLRRPLL